MFTEMGKNLARPPRTESVPFSVDWTVVLCRLESENALIASDCQL